MKEFKLEARKIREAPNTATATVQQQHKHSMELIESATNAENNKPE